MSEQGQPCGASEVIIWGLKEAAIDSPTFRAGVLHFADQVDIIERWLESWIKSVLKCTQEAGALEGIINGFLSQIIPPANVSEAILDHDYTLLALNSYGEGARELWTSTILGMRKMEAKMVEPVRSLIHNELKTFKDSRRVLEQTQKAYDGLLYRFSAQAKKEPSSLREDAFQVHEARKLYLKASMDFSVIAVQLRSTLDKVLVKVFSDQWREMRNTRANNNSASGKWNIDIERVRSWSRELENGEAVFRKDLQSARRQIEDSTEADLRPPRELEAYATPVPSINGPKAPVTTELTGQEPPQAEKQGWLFLKTISGKPTKTVWVRRWVFVKNGIFGWLVQGSRSGGVEESDRIGVLLCNIRPITSEERLFTFEIKTKDLSIVLQADSQGELVEWMKAFEIAKQKALEDPTSTDSPGLEGPNQDPAFAISSPLAPEFAASAADSGMQQFREDGPATGLERGSTLPVPGADIGLGLLPRNSTDGSGQRRSTATERDGESGKDHAARIIQKLDLHRKSTGGPQPGGPPPSSPALAGGGIASLIAASHTVMPVGPGVLPQSPQADAPSLRVGGFRKRSDIPLTSMAPSTLVNAPAPTNLSATAVSVSGERGIGLGRTDATGGMPSGVMANVWGSSNWGYLNRLQRGEVKAPPVDRPDSPMDPSETAQEASSSRTSSPAHRKTASLPGGVSNYPRPTIKAPEYPNYYPVPLKTQDAQFRLLFPNVSRAEKVVLVFRATWSLNEQQEFPGRVYATEKHIYFYSHHFGLVLTSGIALDSVAEVTAAPGRDYDLLFIHLKETSDNTSSARITIKAFLEPLRLFQQRLNFLVNSCNSAQPPDTETIIKALMKLDQTDSASSPIKDKGEDFTATATSDEGKVSANAFSKSRDLRAAVMFDGRMYGASQDESRDTGKIKLPRQPVLYVPTGMDCRVVDKIFDISPKALFHVLFGDRSAIWQLLYHERHAQRQSLHPSQVSYKDANPLRSGIKQGSWTQHEQGRLRRGFEYQVHYSDFFGTSCLPPCHSASTNARFAGRLRSATITDYQMVDVLNDHLCYVVTDRKTAWHLPRNENFSLLSKIVITHHAKSKCRLAIYSKVDWTNKIGILQGIISNRALTDLELNALDLSDLIADQVWKLGAQSRTRKAIQIFGQVGVQTQALEFAGSDAPITTQGWRSMRRRTVGRLLADCAVASTQRLLASIMDCLVALCRWVFKATKANTVLLAILGASVLANVIFSSNGTAQWWSDRQAGNYLARLGIGSEHTMSKAVYLRDTDDAWNPQLRSADGSKNMCRETFESYWSGTEVGAPRVSAGAFKASAGQASVERLRRSRQQLGTRRHDLMVALRVINSIELEMVEAEWEGWIYGETAQCNQIEQVLGQDSTNNGTGRPRNGGTKQVDWAQRSSKSAGNKAVTKAPREDAGSAADEVGQRLKGWVKIGVGDM
ncbi:MAG: hypothetical protein LQ345_003856 [Seirophora villosa]|nr:MAG: hypothetical protein LQ345_003856 [Seirophora villosa]